MFILVSNEPIKVVHFQKLANQSMVTDAVVIKMAAILLVKARKTLVLWWSEKCSNRKKWNKNMGSDKFISTRFRYIIQRCKKTGNLIMFRWYFSKYEICSKSFTKVLYGNMFLVSENIFKLVCHCASWKWSQICCPHVRDIAEKSLNKLLLLFILKSSNRRWSVKEMLLKFSQILQKTICVGVSL